MAWDDKKFADRTIDGLMDVFTENLDVDDTLLAKCLAKGLITGEDSCRIGATVKAGRNGEAVRDLMLHIKRSSPEYLETFCGVLDDCKSRFLVPRINEEYRKQLEAKKEPCRWLICHTDSSATDGYKKPLKNVNPNLVGDGKWPFEKAELSDKQQLPENFEEAGPKHLLSEVAESKESMISSPEDAVDAQNPLGKCSFKCQSIQDNYKDLTGALPIANLLSALFSKGVIVADQKEEIEKKSLQKDKVSYLFDQIILPALTAGHDLKYNNLIAVMLSNDDTTVQHLAKKLIQGEQRREAAAAAMKN